MCTAQSTVDDKPRREEASTSIHKHSPRGEQQVRCHSGLGTGTGTGIGKGREGKSDGWVRDTVEKKKSMCECVREREGRKRGIGR